MKRIPFIVLAITCYSALAAQPKDFEGTAVYRIDTRSKVEGVSDRVWKNMIAFGDSMTVMIKQGNYRQISGPSEMYSITKDQKVYIKFKGIDTLFYLDYSSDTSSVLSVSKSGEKKSIAGFECNAITIKTPGSTRKYYYAPALYMNPEYDKNNKLGRYDVFTKETSSLYLGANDENEIYTLSQTCTRLQPGVIDNSVFELPKLPQKMFTAEAIMVPPTFPRAGGFIKYLQINLDASLGAKYIKIPKGEESATQTVMVAFMINEKGRVVNAQVENKSEVHTRLAEEALRVINSSPAWTPASVLGEKIAYWHKQPVTFTVTRK